jgi:hypothetical protein
MIAEAPTSKELMMLAMMLGMVKYEQSLLRMKMPS